MEKKKFLFIPRALDGLQLKAGSTIWRAEWPAKAINNIGHVTIRNCDPADCAEPFLDRGYEVGADVYDMSGRFAGYDLYVFQKAYRSQRSQEMIQAVAAYREAGRSLLAFDLCDADFLDHDARRALLKVLPLFDFAVATTQPIAEWLEGWLPTYTIPDRLDFHEVSTLAGHEQAQSRPRLCWIGYRPNAEGIDFDSFFQAKECLGMGTLDIYALDHALPFPDFVKLMSNYDILINPRRPGPAYKTDNKSQIASAIGVAVAETPADLANLVTREQRIEEFCTRRLRIGYIEQSAQDWLDIYSTFYRKSILKLEDV